MRRLWLIIIGLTLVLLPASMAAASDVTVYHSAVQGSTANGFANGTDPDSGIYTSMQVTVWRNVEQGKDSSSTWTVMIQGLQGMYLTPQLSEAFLLITDLPAEAVVVDRRDSVRLHIEDAQMSWTPWGSNQGEYRSMSLDFTFTGTGDTERIFEQPEVQVVPWPDGSTRRIVSRETGFERAAELSGLVVGGPFDTEAEVQQAAGSPSYLREVQSGQISIEYAAP